MIRELPLEDRPYEKLEKYGANRLTDAELLAIILKSGTRNISSVKLAQNILHNDFLKEQGFNVLKNLSITELTKYDGIGKVKAIQILALFEISKRINLTSKNVKDKIKSPDMAYELLRSDMEDLKQETIKTIIMNRKADVVAVVTNAIGGQSKIVLTPKEVLSEPIKQMASSIILAHNHPSGDPHPSKADVDFTENIIRAAQMFDIEVLDHIVIGKNSYKSLKQMELI